MTRPPRREIVRPRGGKLAQRIGSVQRVVQRSPPSVRGIDRVTRVRDGHDELRAGDGRDLGIPAIGVDAESRPNRHEVADLFEKRPVLDGVMRSARSLTMPTIDRRLHRCPHGEQFCISRRRLVDQSRQTVPEAPGVDPRGRQGFGLEHLHQFGADEQIASLDVRHDRCSNQEFASSAGFTSLQKTSIVRFASSSVMSPAGSCNTM